MQNKHDITLTYTLDVTATLKADTLGRCSDEEFERRFMRSDYAAHLAERVKCCLGVDDVLLRDLKLFIHDGNSVKEVTP